MISEPIQTYIINNSLDLATVKKSKWIGRPGFQTTVTLPWRQGRDIMWWMNDSGVPVDSGFWMGDGKTDTQHLNTFYKMSYENLLEFHNICQQLTLMHKMTA
jgi:hypothetical protein